MRKSVAAFVAVGSSLALVLAGCGNNSSGDSSGSGGSGGSSAPAAAGGGNGAKVGVILPETASSARWAGFDEPMLKKALEAQGLTPIIENAQGDTQKFSQIADTMLSQKVKVLIVAAPTGDSGAAVEQIAAKQGVPVIDYDRLNLGGSAQYYVSFDNVRVGHLQGQALADSLKDKKGAQVIEIEGAPTDNNATLFKQGQEEVVKPLYADGSLKLVNSRAIDKWDNQLGGQVFEQLLTANKGKIDGVLAANDGLAGAVITVLQKYHLAGKVPVTGQDATADGLRAILSGQQYSTVFKPIQEEADAAAQLAAALVKGSTGEADKVATATSHDPTGNRDVKSVLLTPQPITKDNVKLVIDKGYVKASEVCTGAAKAACDSAGIK